MDRRATSRPVPSSKADWRRMGRAARQVLSTPRFAVLAAAVTLFVLSLLVLALNPWTVVPALTSRLPPDLRFRILVAVLPFVGTGFGTLEAGLVVGAAGALGLAAAILSHAWLRISALDSASADAGFRWAVRWFGVACAACASTMVLGVLPVFGVLRPSLVLPLDGIEFTVPALLASLLSIHRAAACTLQHRAGGPAAAPPGV